jgi:hypothetical protein
VVPAKTGVPSAEKPDSEEKKDEDALNKEELHLDVLETQKSESIVMNNLRSEF